MIYQALKFLIKYHSISVQIKLIKSIIDIFPEGRDGLCSRGGRSIREIFRIQ